VGAGVVVTVVAGVVVTVVPGVVVTVTTGVVVTVVTTGGATVPAMCVVHGLATAGADVTATGGAVSQGLMGGAKAAAGETARSKASENILLPAMAVTASSDVEVQNWGKQLS
jgi:hypothetical protein